MNTEEIKERNRLEIESILKKHKIDEDVDTLLEMYTSVYTTFDKRHERFRLMGVKEEYEVAEYKDGDRIVREKIPGTEKQKRVQLYVLSKRMLNSLSQEILSEIKRDLTLLASDFKQYKLLEEAEMIERMRVAIEELSNSGFWVSVK